MSVTIANGYRLSPDISITHLARTLPDRFAEARHKAIVRSVAELVVQIEDAGESKAKRLSALKFATNDQVSFDRISVASTRSTVGIARDVLLDYQDSFRKRFARRSPSLDITLSISFVTPPASPDEIYALVSTEVDEYIKVWESIEGVSEYFYWNGSDSQLSKMTRKEWKGRGAKWESIADRSGAIPTSLTWEMDTLAIALEDIDDAEMVAAVADVRMERAASLEWAKSVFGEIPEFAHLFREDTPTDPDSDEDDNGDDTSELVPR